LQESNRFAWDVPAPKYSSAGTAAAATLSLREKVTDFFRLVLMTCPVRWSRPRVGRSLFDCFVDRDHRNR
jgi:hypothetical protein